EEMIVAEIACRSHRSGCPDIDHLPDFHTKEVRSGDANNVKYMAVGLKRTSNRALAFGETAIPKPIANHGNGVLPWLTVVPRRYQPSGERSDTKHLEVIAGYNLLSQPFWFCATNREEGRISGLIGHQIRKLPIARLDFYIQRVRTADAGGVTRVSSRSNHSEQRRRISHRKHA